jgi:regulator of sigma D
VEIHKQIFAVFGNVMNRQNVTNWCHEFSEGRADVHDEVQEKVMTWLKKQAADFYVSGIQKLFPRLNKYFDNISDYVEK